jgi:hypothetical protein
VQGRPTQGSAVGSGEKEPGLSPRGERPALGTRRHSEAR